MQAVSRRSSRQPRLPGRTISPPGSLLQKEAGGILRFLFQSAFCRNGRCLGMQPLLLGPQVEIVAMIFCSFKMGAALAGLRSGHTKASRSND